MAKKMNAGERDTAGARYESSLVALTQDAGTPYVNPTSDVKVSWHPNRWSLAG